MAKKKGINGVVKLKDNFYSLRDDVVLGHGDSWSTTAKFWVVAQRWVDDGTWYNVTFNSRRLSSDEAIMSFRDKQEAKKKARELNKAIGFGEIE